MQFPEGFAWGACVGGLRHEGGDFESDWWRWVQRPGRIAGDAVPDRAAAHFDRYPEDFLFARHFGLNTLFLTLSWARIQPQPDTFSDDALEHYAAVLTTARAEGLTPIVALWEASAPAWFTDAGGWANREAAQRFAVYATRVCEALAGLCNRWVPLHMPGHWLDMACRMGVWPGLPSRCSLAHARRNMTQAHRLAAEVLCERGPQAEIGVSGRALHLEPDNPYSAWDLRAARRIARQTAQGLALEPARAPQPDFVCVAYGGEMRVRFSPWRWWRGAARFLDAEGQPVAPDEARYAAGDLLPAMRARLPRTIPAYLIGSAPGVSEADRRHALLDHLYAAARLREEGFDVRGFLFDALLDGFEWTRGFTKRTGLAHVDFATFARTPNPCAFLLHDVIQAGALRKGLIAKHCREWTLPEDMLK